MLLEREIKVAEGLRQARGICKRSPSDPLVEGILEILAECVAAKLGLEGSQGDWNEFMRLAGV